MQNFQAFTKTSQDTEAYRIANAAPTYDAVVNRVLYSGCRTFTGAEIAWNISQYVKNTVGHTDPDWRDLMPLTVDIPGFTKASDEFCQAFVSIRKPERVWAFVDAISGYIGNRGCTWSAGRSRHPSAHHMVHRQKEYSWKFGAMIICTTDPDSDMDQGCKLCRQQFPLNSKNEIGEVMYPVTDSDGPSEDTIFRRKLNPPPSIRTRSTYNRKFVHHRYRSRSRSPKATPNPITRTSHRQCTDDDFNSITEHSLPLVDEDSWDSDTPREPFQIIPNQVVFNDRDGQGALEVTIPGTTDATPPLEDSPRPTTGNKTVPGYTSPIIPLIDHSKPTTKPKKQKGYKIPKKQHVRGSRNNSGQGRR